MLKRIPIRGVFKLRYTRRRKVGRGGEDTVAESSANWLGKKKSRSWNERQSSRMGVMKRTKAVSLFVAFFVLAALATAAFPDLELCRAHTPDSFPSDGEAPATTGNVLSGSHDSRSSYESNSDQLLAPCDNGGETIHAHGCHSHALPSGCASLLDFGSPPLIVIPDEALLTGGTVQPPFEPPRIPA